MEDGRCVCVCVLVSKVLVGWMVEVGRKLGRWFWCGLYYIVTEW